MNFKKKKPMTFNEPFGVIMSTMSAKENFINDSFNKKIFIFRNFDNYLRGRHEQEFPYTEEDVNNIIEIFDIPIIEEFLDTTFTFDQETSFGEIVTRR